MLLRMLFRLWVVATICWWGYNLYLHRDEWDSLKQRDWALALKYGFNNFFCDVKVLGNCQDLAIPYFHQSQVNETFGLIVTFVGYPVLALLACLIVAWILRVPS